MEGVDVTFVIEAIIGGAPVTLELGPFTTNANGEATTSYSRTFVVNDVVGAEFFLSGFPTTSDHVVIDWVAAPVPEPASIVLVPSGFVVNTVGDVQVLTATVTDTNGGPVAGVEVTFLEFQSFDIIGTDTTDVSGVAQLPYTRLVPTNDIVRAEFQAGGFPQGSDDVLIDWVAAAPDPTPPGDDDDSGSDDDNGSDDDSGSDDDK